MIRCLIVDDEEMARASLERLCSRIEDLEVVGTCDNALDAMSLLKKLEVDLLFLDIEMPDFSGIDPVLDALEPDIGEQISRDALYATYIDRQNADIMMMRRDEGHEIPQEFDYMALRGLSNEIREKLSNRRPATLAQAGRIEGMTPAALTLLLAAIHKANRLRTAG